MSVRKAGAVIIAAATALGLAACASQQSAAKNNNNASDYNTQLGIAYLRQGDIPLAKEKLDRALKENPSNPAVHGARAMLFDRMNEPAQADREFKTALSLAPNDPDVSNNYAVYLCQSGRTDEGVRRFEEVARNALYRKHGSALYQHRAAFQLVRVRLQLGREFTHLRRDQVVRNNVLQQLKPEQRDLRKDLALARNARRQHMIECRNAVGCNHQQRIANCV